MLIVKRGQLSGAIPDRGGDLQAGVDCGAAQTTNRSDLPATTALILPASTWRNRDGQLRVICYQYGGDSQSGLEPVGSPANWRCVVLEKLSKVKLLEGDWRTAPNHLRPGSLRHRFRY
jgi:hypothetical protein